jgi:triacylglycerol lipase
MAALSSRIFTLLRHAASWAGITLKAGADFTAGILRAILGAMMARLKQMGQLALTTAARGLRQHPGACDHQRQRAQAMPL